jgi:hypothetical protein
MLPSLAELYREVRLMSRRIHRQALAQTQDGKVEYSASVAAVIDDILNQAGAHERVVCFASAAEFGIPMHHLSERCRLAAMHTGSGAMRVLYWTAVLRMRQSQPSPAPAMPVAMHFKGSVTERLAPARNSRSVEQCGAIKTLPERLCCARCEALRVDPHNFHGHDALRPTSQVVFRPVGSSLLTQTIEHQCNICRTEWTRHKSAASLFVNWCISRQTAVQRARPENGSTNGSAD